MKKQERCRKRKKIKLPSSYDVIGGIAILKLRGKTGNEKKEIAEKLLNERKNIKTVLEKKEKVKGKLRTIKTKFLAGKKTTITIHKESGCIFKLDIEKCYFSPRLSNERLEIAEKIKKLKGKNVLVMFAGVAPYSIVIAKKNPNKKIYSIELNRTASKYAEENVKLNKLENVKVVQGDVKKIFKLIEKYSLPKKYDIIVMPRPQLPYSFLHEAFSVSKKGTYIFYYDFCKKDEIEKVVEKIKEEAKKIKKGIKILNKKKAGEIAPYKYRIRIDFKII